MFSRFFGRSPSVGRSCLSSSWIIMAAAMLCFNGCGKYMKEPPPKSELCGYWQIDLARTKWEWGAPHIQNDRQNGYLLLRSDGTFSFKDMPNLLELAAVTPTFHHNGTGKWGTDKNVVNGTAYLWLDINEIDGQQPQPQQQLPPQLFTLATAEFLRKGGKHKYLLSFYIVEPDTGEVLVLEKVERKLKETARIGSGRD